MAKPGKPSADQIRAVMAHLGSKTSDKKTAASRLNAKKGGWPKGRPRGKKKPVSV